VQISDIDRIEATATYELQRAQQATSIEAVRRHFARAADYLGFVEEMRRRDRWASERCLAR
jgi:hypothetical protein